MTPKWILWRIITTSWKFLSRRIFLKRKFYLITGRFSQNQRVVRPRRTNDKARFVLCFIANCFITGTIINGDGVTQFQQNQVNPCLMLTNVNTFIQKIICIKRDSQSCFRNTDATLMQLWRNSDAKSLEYEECEHDGPKSQLQHMSATQWRMISRFTVADDLKSSSKITCQRTILEDHQSIKVKPPWKIKDYELTKSKEC